MCAIIRCSTTCRHRDRKQPPCAGRGEPHQEQYRWYSGITTPGLPIKSSYDAIIRRNFVIDNNTPNFGILGSLVSQIPAGKVIIVMSGDEVIIEDNVITGNNNAGIIITSQDFVTDRHRHWFDPNPDAVQIRDNVMFNNGVSPEAK